MKLPRFTATTPPAREPMVTETGLVRATDIGALTRTGGQAYWGSLGQLGAGMQVVANTVFAVNEDKQKLDDDLQTARRTGFVKKGAQDLWDTIKTMDIQTDEQAIAVSKDATAGLDKLISVQMKDASPRVKRNLQLYSAEALPAFAVETKRLANSIWLDFHLAEEDKIIKSLTAEGRYQEAEKRIETLDKSGLITHKAALKMKGDAQQLAIKAANESARKQLEVYLSRMAADKGWQAAADWLGKPENVTALLTEMDMKIEDVDSLLEDLRTFTKQQQVDFKKIWDSRVGDTEQQLKQLIDDGNYEQIIKTAKTLDDPDSPLLLDLPPEYKSQAVELATKWQERAQKALDAEANGKENPINQSDPAKEKEISDAIVFNPQSLTSEYIRSFVGKGKNGGLSLAKAEEYEAKWQQAMDKNSAINAPVAQNYFKILKETETDRIFSLDKTTNSIIYGQMLNKLTDYFVNYRDKNEKDPTLKEAQSFYEELVGAYRKPESPFTEARVQQMLGELQSGGAVSIYGIVMPFTKPEDAVNHALRTLGPNWQEIAPEAVQIIKSKWPNANIEIKTPIKRKAEFQIGERVMHPNGGTYEYTGQAGDKAWKLVKE